MNNEILVKIKYKGLINASMTLLSRIAQKLLQQSDESI